MKACFLNVSKTQAPRGDDGIIYSSRATFPDGGLLKYNTVTSGGLLVSEFISILLIKALSAVCKWKKHNKSSQSAEAMYN